MAAWRNSKATAKLLAQVNALAPDRDKSWDGTIGDTAHSKRKSDHNPNAAGVVCAIDVTHDPKHGIDGERLAETLRASGDPRIRYVIWNKRIWNPTVSPGWRKYGGAPHDHHVHLSVVEDPKLYDSAAAWKLPMLKTAAPAKPEQKPTVGERPLTEAEMREAQDLLRKLGYTDVGETDGVWGANSKGALTKFCDANRLAYKDPPTIGLLWAMQGKDKPAITAPVSPERRDASPKKVEDIAPEAKTAKDAGFLATVSAALQAAVLGVMTWIATSFKDLAQAIVDNKDTLLSYGVWAAVAVLAASVAVSYYQKRKAASIVRTVTAAVQEGDRFRSAGQ